MTDLNALLDSMTPQTLLALACTVARQLEDSDDSAERFALSRLQLDIFNAGARNCGDEFEVMFRDAIAEPQYS